MKRRQRTIPKEQIKKQDTKNKYQIHIRADAVRLPTKVWPFSIFLFISSIYFFKSADFDLKQTLTQRRIARARLRQGPSMPGQGDGRQADPAAALDCVTPGPLLVSSARYPASRSAKRQRGSRQITAPNQSD